MASSRIFVKGLPYGFGADDLRTHFSKQYTVTDAKFIPNRRIGYIGYKTSEEASKAVKYYNKSFIRMSRIGVELARSIEEQEALGPRANAVNRGKRKFEESNRPKTTTHDGLGKKHETAQAVRGTVKLQEYLEVMKPPSKSKMWVNNAANTVQDSIEPVSNTENMFNAQTGSDEDYEPVPKKPKIDLKSFRELDQAAEPSKQAQEVQEISDITPTSRKGNTGLAYNADQATSDVDWLRSRTCRLLGLVDDDDDTAPETSTLHNDDEGKGAKALEPLQHIDSSNVHDVGVKTDEHAFKVNNDVVETPLNEAQDIANGNGRLFVRNLLYTTSEDELRKHFEKGGYGNVEEVHLPIDSRSGNNKGFAHVQYSEPEAAMQALQSFDKQPFQGRLLHVMLADAKKEVVMDDFAISKLPLKKQQQIKRRSEAATSTFNWNSMYMNADAVMSSMADRLGVAKSDLLDPTSSDAAVKQAHAETHIIQETKSYFRANGVDLDAFKRKERGHTAILVKNFPYGTKEDELRNLFESHGRITRLLIPPSGTIAVVAYGQSDHARSAFGSLAYRKFKDSILFLEKAPTGLFSDVNDGEPTLGASSDSKFSSKELLEKGRTSDPVNTSTLFVRNLNFVTTTDRLREVFQPLDGFLSARVKTKSDLKKPGQILSMGFGFIEFRTNDQAQAGLAAMDGYKLDGHDLVLRASHRETSAAEDRRKRDQANREVGRRTKIIIKNLPFEASKKDVRSLFGAYGQLRSVRVPKKLDTSTRGFAFAEFVTAREAENALDSLKDTHLLGRRLVLEFAAADALDPEQEIEKMQQKVGKQADKVALQKLTGSARKKFNVEGGDELDQGG